MRTLTQEQRARVVFSWITEPGDGVAGKLIRELGPVRAYMAIRDGHYDKERDTPEVNALIQRAQPRLLPTVVDEILTACERHGIEPIFPDDHQWPTSVDDLGNHAPHMLYTRGKLGWEKAHSVAIVGARAATSYGEHIAMELTSDLSRDHIIVSGAAYGIDGAAHRAALAAGGSTIAVLAGGVDRPYPAGHENLIARIAQAGTVMSEVPPGSAPTKWRFLQRNRIIAALGQASIVVEAGFRSGSLNEAGHAQGLGRPVGAVPGPVTSAASAGCHRLIKDLGASLVTDADDVRALTGAMQREENIV